MPGAVDADTNLVVGKPELGVRIDRAKAGDLGVRVQDIAATLNVLVGGLKVTDYYEGGEQYEVHLRAEPCYRRDAEGIAQAEVPSARRAGAAARTWCASRRRPAPRSSTASGASARCCSSPTSLPGYSAQAIIDGLTQAAQDLKMPASLQLRLHRPLARAGQGGAATS